MLFGAVSRASLPAKTRFEPKISLIIPLTPGSWLVFIGLELLGVRVLLSDKLKFWKRK